MKYALSLICALWFLCACTRDRASASHPWGGTTDSLLNASEKMGPYIDSLRHRINLSANDSLAFNLMNELVIAWPNEWRDTLAQAALGKSRKLGNQAAECQSLCSMGVCHIRANRFGSADSILAQAWHLALRLNNNSMQAFILFWQGEVQRMQDKYPAATRLFGRSLEISRQYKLSKQEAWCLISLGHVNYMLDNYEQALAYFDEAMRPINRIHDRYLHTECLKSISAVYRILSEYDKSLDYAQQALVIARQLNDHNQEAACLSGIGNIYYMQDGNDEALRYYRDALHIARTSNNKSEIAFCLSSIGEVYRMKNDYAQSLHYLSEAMGIARHIKNKNRISDCLSCMGEIYRMQNDTAKALDYFRQAIGLSKETGDKNRLAYCLSSLAEIYTDAGRYTEARAYLEEAVGLARAIGDRLRMADCLNSMGNLYFEQNSLKADSANPALYHEALNYYRQSLELAHIIDDKNLISVCLTSMGQVQLCTGNLPQAVIYGNEGLQVAKGMGMPENIKSSAQLLHEVYQKQKDYKRAYTMLLLHQQMKDSINNEESVKDFVSQEYHAKSEELAIEQQRKDLMYRMEQGRQDSELRRQKTIRNTFTTGFLLLLVLALVIWRSLRQNKKKNQIISRQKQEVESKSHLLEQKNKEMMDSIHYAQRIQKALLASDQVLANNFSANHSDYFIYFSPKDVVSGDFYWASHHYGKFYLAIADSTGHGVPGAFMSLLNISFLNEAVNEKNLEQPDAILGYVRQRLIRSFAQDGGNDGMDCCLLCFDFENRELSYASANNRIILVRNNELNEQPTDRMPVGKSPKDHLPYTLQCLHWQKGDVLYAFTDGYIDQFGGPKSKKFMYKKLNQLLLQSHHLPMQAQQALLKENFLNWKGDLEQVDDVLLMGIRLD